jgi:cytidylate kinase
MNDNQFYKISLAGDLGSGKSTVAKLLIADMGAEYYSTGAIVRSIAEKHGMSVVELNHYMETHPEIDNEIDNGLKELSGLEKSLVIDSRMAWHFTNGTFKVYLSTDVETSAIRIMNANREGEHAASLEETVRQTRARRESEKKRYMEQYGVDIKDLTNYSVIVDTTYATPAQVANAILSSLEIWKDDKSYKCAYLSAERLNYPDDEIDTELMLDLSYKIEECEPVPDIEAYEKDGEFYVVRGVESALAYSMTNVTFIPVNLVPERKTDYKFVKMKNSL